MMSSLHFDDETPEGVKRALLTAQRYRLRVRIWYGDMETGEAWPDEYHVLGYIGQSMGPRKVPLLIHNRRSFGGPALLDHCIVRVDTTDGRTLYKHPRFSAGSYMIDSDTVYLDGRLHARLESEEAARRYVSFMTGARYSK